MAEHSRYHVSDKGAGISRGVLKNKLGITSKKQLADAETLLLADAYTHFFELLRKGKVTFDLSLLFAIHKYFLGPLYEWAGAVRTVNISKDDLLFAPVAHLHQALENFHQLLKKNLPTRSHTKGAIARKLAIIHNEFNVIHSFREGDGRTIRLFLDLVVTDVGYDPIAWDKKSNTDYLRACIEGVVGKHEAMAKIIQRGLHTTKRS